MSILGSFFMFITWLGQAGLLFDRSIEWSEYGFRFSAVRNKIILEIYKEREI